MTIQRLENVGIVVDDLAAATTFFVELGLKVLGEGPVEGGWVDRVVGLEGVRVDIAMLETSDGHGRLELMKFRPAGSGRRPERAAEHLVSAVSHLQSMTSTPPSPGCKPAARSSLVGWSATKTVTGSATSAARRIIVMLAEQRLRVRARTQSRYRAKGRPGTPVRPSTSPSRRMMPMVLSGPLPDRHERSASVNAATGGSGWCSTAQASAARPSSAASRGRAGVAHRQPSSSTVSPSRSKRVKPPRPTSDLVRSVAHHPFADPVRRPPGRHVRGPCLQPRGSRGRSKRDDRIAGQEEQVVDIVGTDRRQDEPRRQNRVRRCLGRALRVHLRSKQRRDTTAQARVSFGQDPQCAHTSSCRPGGPGPRGAWPRRRPAGRVAVLGDGEGATVGIWPSDSRRQATSSGVVDDAASSARMASICPIACPGPPRPVGEDLFHRLGAGEQVLDRHPRPSAGGLLDRDPGGRLREDRCSASRRRWRSRPGTPATAAGRPRRCPSSRAAGRLGTGHVVLDAASRRQLVGGEGGG